MNYANNNSHPELLPIRDKEGNPLWKEMDDAQDVELRLVIAYLDHPRQFLESFTTDILDQGVLQDEILCRQKRKGIEKRRKGFVLIQGGKK